MDSNMRYDIVVLGGGIVGCTCAFYLARKGLQVALVERGEIGC
ncbi:MAG: FAD-binding oxidoreductase, partial [Chromatiales bacterium]|nr:FAD-binding oxidoreductase [Chromatiales bacterium]